MADNQRVRPIVAFGKTAAELGRAADHGCLRLFLGRPPDFLDQPKVARGPVAFEGRTGSADVARKGISLPHGRIDHNRNAERSGNRPGGL